MKYLLHNTVDTVPERNKLLTKAAVTVPRHSQNKGCVKKQRAPLTVIKSMTTINLKTYLEILVHILTWSFQF
jgi:hypothetical protein